MRVTHVLMGNCLNELRLFCALTGSGDCLVACLRKLWFNVSTSPSDDRFVA